MKYPFRSKRGEWIEGPYSVIEYHNTPYGRRRHEPELPNRRQLWPAPPLINQQNPQGPLQEQPDQYQLELDP